jgi:hypothetical protein
VPYIKTDVKNVFGKKTECYCPKCNRLHSTWLDWKGRGTPRKFCPKCQHVICNRIGGLDEDSGFNKRAISVGR